MEQKQETSVREIEGCQENTFEMKALTRLSSQEGKCYYVSQQGDVGRSQNTVTEVTGKGIPQ